jgi:predicted nucleic acid-binding protein
VEALDRTPRARAGQCLRTGEGAATLILYLETSALVKLFVQEDHSEFAREAVNAAERRATSRITYAEARAALAAALRNRRLSSREHQMARQDLDELFGTLTIVEVSDERVQEAGDLAERYALRGYDAVHLASALALDPDEVSIATWDTDLVRAAPETGLGLVTA